jgi:hypothetical protein
MRVCFECEKEGEIHNHHVVPRVRGGTKTIPLCTECHGIVHGKNMLRHGDLIKEGIRKALERGSVLGRKPKAQYKTSEIIKLRREGWSQRNIAELSDISAASVNRILKKNKHIIYK